TFTLTHTGNQVTDTIATLPAGHSDTITVTVTINASVANGSTITNTAMVSSTTPDPNTSNNSSTATTTISNSSGLFVQHNQTKPISFWNGPQGQELIGLLPRNSGGQTLGQWMASTFPRLFGGANG